MIARYMPRQNGRLDEHRQAERRGETLITCAGGPRSLPSSSDGDLVLCALVLVLNLAHLDGHGARGSTARNSGMMAAHQDGRQHVVGPTRYRGGGPASTRKSDPPTAHRWPTRRVENCVEHSFAFAVAPERRCLLFLTFPRPVAGCSGQEVMFQVQSHRAGRSQCRGLRPVIGWDPGLLAQHAPGHVVLPAPRQAPGPEISPLMGPWSLVLAARGRSNWARSGTGEPKAGKCYRW